MRTEDVLDQIDGALEDWGVGPDAMRMNGPAGTGLASTRRVRLNLHINTSAFEASMRRMAEVINQVGPALAEILRKINALNPPKPDRHHPKPLCIDGHAYHQRRRNRRKR